MKNNNGNMMTEEEIRMWLEHEKERLDNYTTSGAIDKCQHTINILIEILGD
jgi:hypothetical protein